METDFSLSHKGNPLNFFTQKNLLAIIGSCASCALCFYLLTSHYTFATSSINIEDISSRIVGTMIAILSFGAAYAYLKKHITLSTWHQLLSMTIGYLIYDMFREIITKPSISQSSIVRVYAHHTIFLGLIILSLSNKKYISTLAQGMLAELTTPFIHISWFIVKTKQQNTPLGITIGIGLLLVLAISRVGNFTHIYLKHRKDASMATLILFISITLLNYYWFCLILKKSIQAIIYHMPIDW